MNQVLTQSEVDALLSAVSDGSVDTGAQNGGQGGAPGGGDAAGGGAWGDMGVQDAEVTPYDLTNQDRVIRGRMPTLDIIYERFIRLYRMSLSNSLRKIATI
ncbi:MAG: flagellar motor switch protein FliM, partial [Bdellovibrionota bacterium]